MPLSFNCQHNTSNKLYYITPPPLCQISKTSAESCFGLELPIWLYALNWANVRFRTNVFLPPEFYRQKQPPTFQLPAQTSAFLAPGRPRRCKIKKIKKIRPQLIEKTHTYRKVRISNKKSGKNFRKLYTDSVTAKSQAVLTASTSSPAKSPPDLL